jgi:hypothetical protein
MLRQFIFRQNGCLKVILTINLIKIENVLLVITLKKVKKQQMYCFRQLKHAKNVTEENLQRRKLRAHALSVTTFTVKN